MLTGARTALGGAAQWARTSSEAVRRDGVNGVRESARSFYTGLWRLYGLVQDYGTPVYEEEWDLLIVLDACRADLAADVADDYPFLDGETTTSAASCSPEWMDKNFTDEYADEMARTAYVTGNPYSREHVDSEQFALVDDVWRYGWDDDSETLPPDVLTDRAVRVGREQVPDRLILHYMQPHHPFVPNPLGAGADTELDGVAFGEKDTVWNRLRRGELDRETVWAAYRANLEYVLDSVALLLENVDAERAVITADHGNALGEHRMYGHPMYAPTEALRRVPWCVTTATDTGDYEPDPVTPEQTGGSRQGVADGERGDGEDGGTGRADDTDRATEDEDVERKLEHLGYL